MPAGNKISTFRSNLLSSFSRIKVSCCRSFINLRPKNVAWVVTCISEASFSNPDQGAGYPDRNFCGFFQYLQPNAGIVSQLIYNCPFSVSFPIHYSPATSLFYVTKILAVLLNGQATSELHALPVSHTGAELVSASACWVLQTYLQRRNP